MSGVLPKILEFRRASSQVARTSGGEAAFSDSYADLEISETDLNPRAPKNGAEQTGVIKIAPDPTPTHPRCSPQGVVMENMSPPRTAIRVEMTVEEIVSQIRCELEPLLGSAARRAAAQEHERTREWLESRGLPKAARVAQREAYNVLRKYGVIKDAPQSSSACVGRSYAVHEHQPLSDGEVEELAQACVAMLEVKGQSIELTLSEMSAEAGGFLLPEDAPRVRDRANILLAASSRKE